MMKHLVEKIINHEYLTEVEAASIIHAINEEAISTEHLSALLIAIQMRGVQLEELVGFRSALLDLATPIELDSSNAIDLCGTGGDGKNTFNISTTSSLVLAALGKKVIKNGNYGVSSICGSSNVLEELGFEFNSSSSSLQQDLETTNICFLHAPLFHPTLKKVATTRKNLAIRTIFNALGPLVNPVQPNYQLTGAFSMELAKIYQHILRPHRANYKVVYGLNGYDEISLTDSTKILGPTIDQVRTANDFQLANIDPADIIGGSTLDASAKIVVEVLRGSGSFAQTNVVAANVAEALLCFDSSLDLQETFFEVQSFIRSGQPAKHFKLN